MKFQIAPSLICVLVLAACGNSDAPPTTGENAESAARSVEEPAERVAQSESETEPASGKCGKGGTECPDGLECLTWRNGQQACGPMSGPGTVLVKDATLGGGCLSPNPADPLPGASIASVQLIGVDGNVRGYGRMLWDQAGYEVAAERGTPPDGTEFTGDACTEYYNLGCDGQAVFEIVNDAGEVQELREGQTVVVHVRSQKTCGEEVADGQEAAVCNDAAATAQGNLESCSVKVRLVDLVSDLYGPDRVGGTIQYFSPQ